MAASGCDVPRRLPGVNPGALLDGSDPDTEWQGFHPFDSLPQLWNPPSGWLSNTNSTPFTVTVDITEGPLDYPPYMVGAETHNARAVDDMRRRVIELNLGRLVRDDAHGVYGESR